MDSHTQKIPGNISLEHAPCPLGCPVNDQMILKGCDILNGLPGNFTVVKCRTCGLMRTNPRPTSDTIGFYYPDNYGPYTGTKISNHPATKNFLKTAVRNMFNFNVQKLPPVSPPGHCLEIGCASGSFLYEMDKKGWSVEGIEFSAKAAKDAAKKGYKIHVGSLETTPTPEKPFDLIIGWMVIEHLHHPVTCLKKLFRWAKPGAYIALSVPNCASLEFKLFKENWYSLQLPNHLYHFTPKTIKKVLEESGWQLESIHHQRLLNNLIASLGYSLNKKGITKAGQKLFKVNTWGRYWSYLLFPMASIMSLVGQTGRMTIIAKKND